MKGYFIYYFYENENLLYIGKTINLGSRIKSHINEKDWIQSGITIYYSVMSSEADMNFYEPYLISRLKPIHNKEFSTASLPTIELPELEKILFKTIELTYFENITSKLLSKCESYELEIVTKANILEYDDMDIIIPLEMLKDKELNAKDIYLYTSVQQFEDFNNIDFTYSKLKSINDFTDNRSIIKILSTLNKFGYVISGEGRFFKIKLLYDNSLKINREIYAIINESDKYKKLLLLFIIIKNKNNSEISAIEIQSILRTSNSQLTKLANKLCSLGLLKINKESGKQNHYCLTDIAIL